MKEKELTFEIDNIGGVEHVVLRLKPGCNILVGRNAIGKTSAMRAVVRAQGGKVPLERKDGTERGVVQGPGVLLHVRQVVKATGEAEMELADTGPLARLIEPGLKNTEAASRERIRALIELLELSVDDQYLNLLCGEDEGLVKWLREEVRLEAIDDLMLASEKLRHHAHALAREQEDRVSMAEGQALAASERCAVLLESLGGRQALVDQPIDEAKATFDEAIRKHERAVARCEARDQLEAQQSRIREVIGEKPETESAWIVVETAEKDLQGIRSEIQRLRRLLEQTERQEALKKAELSAAEEKLEAIRREVDRWDKQQAILNQPLLGPTRPEVAKLKVELVDNALIWLETAQRSADYRNEEQVKSSAERTRQEAERLASHYRDLAAGIPHRLGEILANAGAPGLTVIEGRLHAISNATPKDFEHRCSSGERVALALDVAATAYHGKVLPLGGEFWASLDPDNRATFARLARERGLFVITEEPTDGELRVEQA